ncbi:hypothetical protein AMTRI_Chr01g134510 [Amborella trichopoda]|uniref:Uncharacterized protein n=1 Tax=Amborella trichopoda TaxID=13333 RepID=U5DGC1_AMBTC|nr:hypothetical protein AMTR_s00068p00185800 [Amborella trichopoda]
MALRTASFSLLRRFVASPSNVAPLLQRPIPTFPILSLNRRPNLPFAPAANFAGGLRNYARGQPPIKDEEENEEEEELDDFVDDAESDFSGDDLDDDIDDDDDDDDDDNDDDDYHGMKNKRIEAR